MAEKFKGQFPNVIYDVEKEKVERAKRVAERAPYNPEDKDILDVINYTELLSDELPNEPDELFEDFIKSHKKSEIDNTLGLKEEVAERLIKDYEKFVVAANRVVFLLRNIYEVVGFDIDTLIGEKIKIENELSELKRNFLDASRRKNLLIRIEKSNESDEQDLKNASEQTDKSSELWLGANAKIKELNKKIESFSAQLAPIKEKLIVLTHPLKYVTENHDVHLDEESKEVWKN